MIAAVSFYKAHIAEITAVMRNKYNTCSLWSQMLLLK